MRNFAIVFGLCIISAAFVNAGYKRALRKKCEDCASEMGYSKEQLAELKKNSDSKYGCVVACVLKKETIMVNGEINEAVAIKKLKELQGKGVDEAQLKKLVDKCLENANKESEECAKALSFGNCVLSEKKRSSSKGEGSKAPKDNEESND